MKYNNPFKEDGKWYRGNTHIHSTVSDGSFSISDCVEAYKQHKYDFVVITDHHEVSTVSGYSDEDFLVIPGSELHPDNPYGGTLYHIVAINIHKKIPVQERHPNEIMKEVAGQGGLSVLAHPYWSGHTVTDLLPLKGYFAMEVFNTACDKMGRAFSESHWDDLLDRAGPVLGIACDDSHYMDDRYAGWIMVKSRNLTIAGIMQSLKQGMFYSTQGPEIFDFRIEEPGNPEKSYGENKRGMIVAGFSPSVSAAFITGPCFGKQIYSGKNQLLTEAVYEIDGHEKYIRLEIVSPEGKKAWSQPIIL